MVKGFCLVFFFSAAVWAAPVEIAFRDSAETPGPKILLSEIADLKGGDNDIRRTLSETVIGFAPPAGRIRRLSVERVENSFLKAFAHRGEVTVVRRPSEMIVRTASATLSRVALEERLRSLVQMRMPWKKEEVLLSFEGLPTDVQIPSGSYTVDLSTAQACDFKGSEPMEALIMQGDKAVRRVPFTVNMRVYATVAVAQKKIRREAILTEQDIRLEEREITTLSDKTFFTLTEAAGRKALRTIVDGRILTDNMIEMPPLIARGDHIRILHREKTAEVAVDGVARQNGRQGDKILVQNSMNRQLQQGLVVEAGLVRLSH